MIPNEISWLNVATLRMDQQRGRPVLLEFSDLLRPSSLRSAAYLSEWNNKYGSGEGGLRVITVFAPWQPFSAEPGVAAQLVDQAGITHAVLLDLDMQLWQLYENEGWPCRYLFDQDLKLIDVHFGEGGYAETEGAIRSALETADDLPLTGDLHPIDNPEAKLVVPTPDQSGCWSGHYEAGEVWAILEGSGTLLVNGAEHNVAASGSKLIVAHERSTAASLELKTTDGLQCHSVCFSPGLA
jgi:mannose-6-phosphate isomerase-like protein (cupin superfamily)